MKSLSANLKRLDMGFIFSLADFKLTLEEYNFDDIWHAADTKRRESEIIFSGINFSDYSDTFIVALDIILREYYSNNIKYEQAEKYFTKFFSVCFSYFIEHNKEPKNYSKVISILEQNDFIDKSVLTEIKTLIEIKNIENNSSNNRIQNSILTNSLKNKNNKKYQIFISSTYIDLKEERQAAVEAILRKGHIPAGMELFSAGDKSQWEIIKKWIDDSDIYLLILGGRYGSINKAMSLSYTEMEYNYALEKEKPLFALILDDEIILSKTKEIISDYDLKNPKYIDFKALVKSKMCSFPKNIDQIKNEINHSLDSLIFEHKDKMYGWIKGNI